MPADRFLTVAESRAAHLREIERHLAALGMREVRLDDVEREIPELETAMSVYRRLSEPAEVETARPAATPAAATVAPASVTTAKPRQRRRSPAPPSFKEFALTQLDSLAQKADEPIPADLPQAALA
ncbi:MAG: hypothetical protein ACYDAC_11645 [Candidatus Dormibacteria bacterium]